MGTNRVNVQPSRVNEKIDEIRACFLGGADPEEKFMRRPVILVSVGNTEQEADKLKATIALLNNYNQNYSHPFEEVKVVVADTLQRHNFWYFTKGLSAENLKKLLADIPENLELSQLAAIIADKFYFHAREAGNIYREVNKEIYNTLSESGRHKVFIAQWEELVPKAWADGELDHIRSNDNSFQDEVMGEKNKLYSRWYRTIYKEYKEKQKFQTAFLSTIAGFLKSKKSVIDEEWKKIVEANPNVGQFTYQEVARACSLNYLLEECAYLMPILTQEKYTGIVYPNKLTEALKVTQKLVPAENPLQWLNVKLTVVPREKRLTYGYCASTAQVLHVLNMKHVNLPFENNSTEPFIESDSGGSHASTLSQSSMMSTSSPISPNSSPPPSTLDNKIPALFLLNEETQEFNLNSSEEKEQPKNFVSPLGKNNCFTLSAKNVLNNFNQLVDSNNTFEFLNKKLSR